MKYRLHSHVVSVLIDTHTHTRKKKCEEKKVHWQRIYLESITLALGSVALLQQPFRLLHGDVAFFGRLRWWHRFVPVCFVFKRFLPASEGVLFDWFPSCVRTGDCSGVAEFFLLTTLSTELLPGFSWGSFPCSDWSPVKSTGRQWVWSFFSFVIERPW